MDDQDAVERATDVEFDAVDTEIHRRSKGRECVLTFGYVQPTVREDVDHLSSFADVIRITSTSSRLFTNHPLLLGLQIR